MITESLIAWAFLGGIVITLAIFFYMHEQPLGVKIVGFQSVCEGLLITLTFQRFFIKGAAATDRSGKLPLELTSRSYIRVT